MPRATVYNVAAWLLTDAEILAERIARITALEVAGKPPASLDRVLDMLDVREHGRHASARRLGAGQRPCRPKRKAALAGALGPQFPARARQIVNPPAGTLENAYVFAASGDFHGF